MINELRTIGLLTAILIGSSVGIPKIQEEVSSETLEIPVEIEEDELQEIKILAMGDIMLGRYVETLMNRHGENYPFENIQGLISDQDIVFANLEGPIVTNHTQTPDFTTSFDFDPQIAPLIASQGYNLVSLANNHTLDKGPDNFEGSIKYLNEAGVQTVGHPRNETGDYSYEKEIKGQNFVFLAFNEAVNPVFDSDLAVETVRTAAENKDDFVVVSIHWGIEYQLQSAEFQRILAHKFIDAGADLIIGHHPHVTQEVEVYENSMIFYSLGNFIFDQYFSQDTQEELAFEMSLSSNGDLSYKLIPVKSIKSQPEIMSDSEKSDWLESFALRSSDLNLQTEIREGKIDLKWKD